MSRTSQAKASQGHSARAQPARNAPAARHRRHACGDCHALARALHDDLAQLLSYALIQIDMAQASAPDAAAFRELSLRHGRDLIKDALRTTRDVIGGLVDAAPPVEPTLDAQCLLLAAEIGALARQPIEADCAPVTPAPPQRVCAELLRAARELLGNACKHAPGARVQLTLRQDGSEGDGLLLTVRDDGPGFDAACLQAPAPGHYGLHTLPDALRGVGATLHLHTRPGAGVRAEVRWAGKAVRQ
ncbi:MULTISPECIES: sensor histidine kinase [Cupriavidus]|nr:ATP-binding protein [Cupriavidus campinensis]URF05703.1 histidine kinase [Cupriavidus campinensis]